MFATEEKETMENTTQTESTGEENQADSEKENSVVALLKRRIRESKTKNCIFRRFFFKRKSRISEL
jgi:hypothetical protein